MLAGGAVTVVVTIRELLPFGDWWHWAVGAVAAALGTVVVRHRTTVRHLAADLFDEDQSEQTRLIIPATEAQIRAANAYSRTLYGREALDVNESLAWWRQNPYGYFMLVGPNGEYLGNVGAPPITKEGESLLMDGSFEERDLQPSHFHPVDAMDLADTIYLASIAVKQPGTEAGKHRTAQLIGSMIDGITQLYQRPMRIVAIAATADGERLLQSAGGQVVCPREGRKDKHNVYEILPDDELVDRMQRRARRRARPADVVLTRTAA